MSLCLCSTLNSSEKVRRLFFTSQRCFSSLEVNSPPLEDSFVSFTHSAAVCVSGNDVQQFHMRKCLWRSFSSFHLSSVWELFTPLYFLYEHSSLSKLRGGGFLGFQALLPFCCQTAQNKCLRPSLRSTEVF